MTESRDTRFPSAEADLVRRDRCPVCSGPHRPATDVDGLHYLQCRACGLTFMDPMPAQAWYDALYAAEYWEGRAARAVPADEVERRLRKEHLRAVSYLRAIAEDGHPFGHGELLEIGCGTGGAIATLADAVGKDAVAIEPDLSSREVATRIGVSVIDGDLSDLVADGRIFDIILLSHVLEHVVDPHEFVMSIRKLLGPEGRLLIEVPNGFTNESLHLFHPYLYTRRALTTLLAQHGLSATVTAHGGASSRLRRHYLLAVARVADGARVRGLRRGFRLGRAWSRAWQHGPVLRRVDRRLAGRAVAPDTALLDRWQASLRDDRT